VNLDGVTLTQQGGTDGFVIKYNPNGNMAWVRQIAGSLTLDMIDAITDASGNVIVTGKYWSRTDFDPGPGRYYLTPGGSSFGTFVVKLNAAGNFVWADTFVNSRNAYNGATSLATDAAGNVYLTGRMVGEVDFDPAKPKFSLTANAPSIFLAKLNANGTFGWAKLLSGGVGSEGRGILAGPAGQLYVTGYFEGTVDFDPSAAVNAHTSVGNIDVFVARYDLSGNYVWSAAVGGPDEDAVFAYDPMSLDTAGDLALTGTFRATTDFDPGPGSTLMTSVDHRDAFILTLRDAPPAAPASIVVQRSSQSPVTDSPRRLAAVRAVFATSQRESWHRQNLPQIVASSALRARRHVMASTAEAASFHEQLSVPATYQE
jgi:hypothetical protein